MTRETTNSAVLNGVRLLDNKGPSDWRDKLRSRATINEPFDNLDMRYGNAIAKDPSVCALAHVFGTFSAGCEALGITVDEAYVYGFEISPLDPRETGEKYQELNSCWKAWFGYAAV